MVHLGAERDHILVRRLCELIVRIARQHLVLILQVLLEELQATRVRRQFGQVQDVLLRAGREAEGCRPGDLRRVGAHQQVRSIAVGLAEVQHFDDRVLLQELLALDHLRDLELGLGQGRGGVERIGVGYGRSFDERPEGHDLHRVHFLGEGLGHGGAEGAGVRGRRGDGEQQQGHRDGGQGPDVHQEILLGRGRNGRICFGGQRTRLRRHGPATTVVLRSELGGIRHARITIRHRVRNGQPSNACHFSWIRSQVMDSKSGRPPHRSGRQRARAKSPRGWPAESGRARGSIPWKSRG